MFLCVNTKLDMGEIEVAIRKGFEAIWQVNNWYSPEIQHERELDDQRFNLGWFEVVSTATLIQTVNIGQRNPKNFTKHLGTKAMDALHIAIAEKYNCGYLVTFDEDFVSARNQVSGLNVRIIHLPQELGILLRSQ